jgi:GT2 family glycosyltransferase
LTELVSVIVVNYNCQTTLRACIGTILHSRNVGELLLVDNASTDGSLDSIKQYNDNRLQIVRLQKNFGLTAARNFAATKAKYNILAITDADIAVNPQWLEYPCLLLKNHKEFGAVQCNVVLRENINSIASSLLNSNSIQLSDFSQEKPNSFYRCLFPIGAAFVIKKEVWSTVKGFDKSFFIGNDDVDFGIRLWSSGYEVIGSNEGTVYHKFGTLRSQKKISPIFQFYGFRNMLFIWTKDLQWKSILKHVLPFSLLFPFMAVRYGGLTGIRGLVSFFKNLPSIIEKRQEIQKIRKIQDKKIIQMMHENGTLPIQLITNDLKMFFRKISKIANSG